MIPAEVIFDGWRTLTAENKIVGVSLQTFQTIVEWSEKNQTTVVKGEDLLKAYNARIKYEELRKEDEQYPYAIALKTLHGLGYDTEYSDPTIPTSQHLKHPSGQEIDCMDEIDCVRLVIFKDRLYVEYKLSGRELRMTRPILLPQMMASIIERMKKRLDSASDSTSTNQGRGE